MGGTASQPVEYITDPPNPSESDGPPDSPPGLYHDDRHENSMSNITPTDFRWSFGGHSVYITGAWDDWRAKAALSRVSSTEFSTVLALPLGTHQYKFIVDGNWKHSPAYPTETDQHGNLNNIIKINPQRQEFDSNDPLIPEHRPCSPIESYDYSTLPQEDQTTEPPTLPRLLASARLDRQSGGDGTNFVRLNHMYGTASDLPYGSSDIRTMASKVRYKKKIVTTILVTSKSKTQRVVGMPDHAYHGRRTRPIPTGRHQMPPSDESRSLLLDALNNV